MTFYLNKSAILTRKDKLELNKRSTWVEAWIRIQNACSCCLEPSRAVRFRFPFADGAGFVEAPAALSPSAGTMRMLMPAFTSDSCIPGPISENAGFDPPAPTPDSFFFFFFLSPFFTSRLHFSTQPFICRN